MAYKARVCQNPKCKSVFTPSFKDQRHCDKWCALPCMTPEQRRRAENPALQTKPVCQHPFFKKGVCS